MAEIAVRDLWIERGSASFGFDRLSARLFDSTRAGPYLLIGAVVLVHLPLLSVVGWLQTGVLSIAVNPGEVFQVIAWPAVVWITLRTKATYETAINDLPDADDPDTEALDLEGSISERLLDLIGIPAAPSGKANAGLEVLAHARVRYAVLSIGLALYGVQLLTNFAGLVGPVAALTGRPVALVRFTVVIPFVLYPIGAEFLTVVIGALVVLPFKIERASLIDFSDPHGFAGLSPAGTLFKNVAVSYFILLTLFALFQTVATGTSPTDLSSSVLLLTGVALGVALFVGPMARIKSYLASAKAAKIDALAEAVRRVGSTDELFPYAEPESIDDTSQYTYNHIRMQRVQSTSELPLNFGMLREFLFALFLPYASSVVFEYFLGYVI
ncbi:hypothetical protein [Halobellus clavatus]|jgi:hypothetical protein|uniref:Uncharacterized protein n=1 Tax=Halobellus clavatus TaxID=660517 RepID=A0A1H3FAJ5_9EURY|nr:hypothetical protein [Halobellus clavatus]SDX88073.1 hypothetical protein SAMN04487946_103274 [Halobellus clavatus]